MEKLKLLSHYYFSNLIRFYMISNKTKKKIELIDHIQKIYFYKNHMQKDTFYNWIQYIPPFLKK